MHVYFYHSVVFQPPAQKPSHSLLLGLVPCAVHDAPNWAPSAYQHPSHCCCVWSRHVEQYAVARSCHRTMKHSLPSLSLGSVMFFALSSSGSKKASVGMNVADDCDAQFQLGAALVVWVCHDNAWKPAWKIFQPQICGELCFRTAVKPENRAN